MENPTAPAPDRMSKQEYTLALSMAKQHAFQGTTPQEKPKAIILAGQPGSGKSRLTAAAKQELAGQGGAVVIDTDQLREYHPRYRHLAEQDYNSSATKVQKDAASLTEDIRRPAIQERRNLVVDGTLNNADRAERLLQKLKESGYEIEVRALAVNEAVSQRGVAARLEKGLAYPRGDIIPRAVEPHIQKEAFAGMPQAIERIERLKLADRVQVYGRNQPEPLYDSAKPQGKTAHQVITSEQSRPQTPLEMAEHARGWDSIIDRATQRKAPLTEQQIYQTAHKQAHSTLRQDSLASFEYDSQASATQRQQSIAIATAATDYAGIKPRHEGQPASIPLSTPLPVSAPPVTSVQKTGQSRQAKKDTWKP